MFQAVSNGSEFLVAALNFHKLIALKATDKKKGIIFNVLLPFTAFPDTSMLFLVQTICADFSLNQCRDSLQMVMSKSMASTPGCCSPN
jgi:hypothetical protein